MGPDVMCKRTQWKRSPVRWGVAMSTITDQRTSGRDLGVTRSQDEFASRKTRCRPHTVSQKPPAGDNQKGPGDRPPSHRAWGQG